jgi:peptide/nickel transport system ATP-binding protein/oligopeptide transport system ATP-binding protein
MTTPLLEIADLHVDITSPRGVVHAVRGVSTSLAAGEFLGIVGESGCGKSTLLRAIVGLLPPQALIAGGEIRLRGKDLGELRQSEMQRVRGRSIAMVFQEPLTALNPVMKVGDQIAEAPQWQLGYSRGQARMRAHELMRRVGIPDPERRYHAYPHQLSGGLRQRVLIATALSAEPAILLCDEPTTALDVTIQDQILKLLKKISDESDLSVIYVTHDLAVVAQLCHRVAVMYAGQFIETGTVGPVFKEPQHPYTAGLLSSVPDVRHLKTMLTPIPGSPPDLAAPPSGCPFHPRCGYRQSDCLRGEFPLVGIGHDRATACIHSDLLATGERTVAVGETR